MESQEKKLYKDKNEIQQKIRVIEEKIESIAKSLLPEYECLARTEKMYPPDGGGHGYKYRTIIKEKNKERDKLYKEIDILKDFIKKEVNS